jgi:hypothetical protein
MLPLDGVFSLSDPPVVITRSCQIGHGDKSIPDGDGYDLVVMVAPLAVVIHMTSFSIILS